MSVHCGEAKRLNNDFADDTLLVQLKISSLKVNVYDKSCVTPLGSAFVASHSTAWLLYVAGEQCLEDMRSPIIKARGRNQSSSHQPLGTQPLFCLGNSEQLYRASIYVHVDRLMQSRSCLLCSAPAAALPPVGPRNSCNHQSMLSSY